MNKYNFSGYALLFFRQNEQIISCILINFQKYKLKFNVIEYNILNRIYQVTYKTKCHVSRMHLRATAVLKKTNIIACIKFHKKISGKQII